MSRGLRVRNSLVPLVIAPIANDFLHREYIVQDNTIRIILRSEINGVEPFRNLSRPTRPACDFGANG